MGSAGDPTASGSTSWPVTMYRHDGGQGSRGPRRAIELPDDADAAKVAAAMNPAMSAWVALRRRVPIQPGQSVLVLGATGNAGTMAVQVAKRLGAGRVVAAGRDPDRLRALTAVGADDVVQLTDDARPRTSALAAAAAEADIVIDYLWGRPPSRPSSRCSPHGSDRSRAMDWIQIGAVAGPTIELPSVALRSANFRLQGSGQGAVSPRSTWPSCRPSSTRLTRHHRGNGQPEAAGRGGANLDPAGRPRPAHRAGALSTRRFRPDRTERAGSGATGISARGCAGRRRPDPAATPAAGRAPR